MLTFSDLKEAYHNAKKHHWETFSADNNLFVTDYAKYLIEFLESEGCPEHMALEFTPRQEVAQ